MERRPKFVRWAVLVGIVIILNVFFQVVRGIIFPTPQYDTYCPTTPAPATAAMGPTACIAAGGQWSAVGNSLNYPDSTQTAPAAPSPAEKGKVTNAVPQGFCDMTTKCNNEYDAAQKTYEGESFVLVVALGVLAFIVGAVPLGSSIVSTGLSYGGALAFIIASIEYWSDAPQLIQLVISAVALVVLIYIGMKRFRD